MGDVKFWMRRPLVLAALGALAAGCGGEGEAEGASQGDAASFGVGGEGEAEGEGEGEGEAEGAGGVGDGATDDAVFLHQLGLMRGHLIAFYELHQAGEFDGSATHAKHPESELYAGIQPALDAREIDGFERELTALAEKAGAPGDIEAEYDAVLQAIRAAMPEASARDTLTAVSLLMKTAGDEYAIGVGDGGEITNLHEYQDAYGFLIAARNMLNERTFNDIDATEAVAIAHEQIDQALTAFAGLTPERAPGEASLIYGAAARVEIAALGL